MSEISEIIIRDNHAPEFASARAGFGRGLVRAGSENEKVVALAADLAESIQFQNFADKFPRRFAEIGIAEQNMIGVAAGMAHAGMIPFAGSYAAFSPGRNWEQIRTMVALNNLPVKIVGSHAGINVGEDGATHQALEDIALMRVLPNMIVLAPGDAREAEQVAIAISRNSRPVYVRLPRANSELIFGDTHEFKIGRSYLIQEGNGISLFSTGTMLGPTIRAAKILEQLAKIRAEIIHFPTIKPLDVAAVINSAKKTGLVATIEEHQIFAGFGGAVSEILSEKLPTKMLRIGINDQFGQSGKAADLADFYGLTPEKIAAKIAQFLEKNYNDKRKRREEK